MDDLILVILVGLALAAVRVRDLLGAVAALGAYSLMMAVLWCRMNAVDVAFTEASVGAGISTVLMLAAVWRVGRRERPVGPRPDGAGRAVSRTGAILVVLVTGAALLYGAQDMPVVGDAEAPANVHPLVVKHYLEKSAGHDGEVGPPNVVTSVLGDYRGYDTLGETVVIFTGGLCVVLLLRLAQRAGPRDEGEGRERLRRRASGGEDT
ncbi:MAG: DUF4040 domain-containing protein [Planctomycetota bacterium]